jgi:peptidoglycan/LPS O-acetylase OafA/YrhL
MINWTQKVSVSGPWLAAFVAIPVAVLAVASFFIVGALLSTACSPSASYCGVTEGFIGGLIIGVLSSIWMLKLFRVAKPLETSIVAIVAVIGTYLLADMLWSGWDAPGLIQIAVVVGLIMLMYGAANYGLTKGLKKPKA